ncbi:MAG: molybdate ABC transporter substrate-binding protein [Pseudomonadota bacterium]
MIRGGFSVLGLLAAASPALSGEATLAVAANFLSTAEALVAAYENDSGHEITVAHGSSGRLFAQIVNGAPFDVFLSADAARPEALEAQGRTLAREVYAYGRLVLVSEAPITGDLATALKTARVALADPAVAPFGLAAAEVISEAGLSLDRIDAVYGDSVGQVAALWSTGNADLAFLAASQLAVLDADAATMALEGRHAPIRQEAVLLARAADNTAARGFFEFLQSGTAGALIVASGYALPE